MTIDPAWAALRDFPPVQPVPAEPEHTPLGARLRERTAAMAGDDAAHQYAHAQLCEAMMRGGIELSQAFDPEDPWQPTEPLLDPDLCPPWALPWLAQLAGVQLTGGMSEQDQRDAIVGLRAQRRGTPAMIEAAVAAALTGDREVIFRERDGDPYRLEVITRPDETPDVAAIASALRLTVPAALVWAHHVVAGWDYQQQITEGGPYSALPARFATYAAMTDNERTA